jgi:hypothetical protein
VEQDFNNEAIVLRKLDRSRAGRKKPEFLKLFLCFEPSDPYFDESAPNPFPTSSSINPDRNDFINML